VYDLEKQVHDLSGNLATMKTEYTGKWLNDAQSFPPLCGTSHNVTQSASCIASVDVTNFTNAQSLYIWHLTVLQLALLDDTAVFSHNDCVQQHF